MSNATSGHTKLVQNGVNGGLKLRLEGEHNVVVVGLVEVCETDVSSEATVPVVMTACQLGADIEAST